MVHRLDPRRGQGLGQRLGVGAGPAGRVDHAGRGGDLPERPQHILGRPRTLARDLAVEREEGLARHAGAIPSRTSFQVIASSSASNEASTMLALTPTVDQRWPAVSSLSMMTRVTASVPPCVIRTLKSTSFMSSMQC